MRRLAAVLLLGAAAAGCVTTRAQTPIERPTLEVPPAPPRVVEPAPQPEVALLPEPVDDLPPPPAAPPPPSRTPRGTPQRDTPKQEPKPDPAAPANAAVEPVQQPAAATQPAPLLRTPATVDTTAAARQIRDTIERTKAMLNGVDYQRLSADRQKEYQNVKDFLTQAEAALKESNLDLAKGLASNAEKIIKELQGR